MSHREYAYSRRMSSRNLTNAGRSEGSLEAEIRSLRFVPGRKFDSARRADGAPASGEAPCNVAGALISSANLRRDPISPARQRRRYEQQRGTAATELTV